MVISSALVGQWGNAYNTTRDCCSTSIAAVNAADSKTETNNPQSVGRITATGSDGEPLSREEELQVKELKNRDREVRAHEAAHMSAGGGVVKGGASFTYQTGPDGRRYAVGGEVGIDASSVKGNPEATIRKMQRVRAAALAPATPSGQDRAVAAAASAKEAAARMQLNKERTEESEAASSDSTEGNTAKESAESQKTGGYTSKGEKTPASDVQPAYSLDIFV